MSTVADHITVALKKLSNRQQFTDDYTILLPEAVYDKQRTISHFFRSL